MLPTITSVCTNGGGDGEQIHHPSTQRGSHFEILDDSMVRSLHQGQNLVLLLGSGIHPGSFLDGSKAVPKCGFQGGT